jgi:hypothetical protein
MSDDLNFNEIRFNEIGFNEKSDDGLAIQANCLGFELYDGQQLVTLYRAWEELPRSESPKPCFAPLYTPSGQLITQYRPADHAWHTGLYFGWVHANQANLWGGPWYLPEKDKYEYVEHSHGVQRHDRFGAPVKQNNGLGLEEKLTWLDADDQPMAAETRTFYWERTADRAGYSWRIDTVIEPLVEQLTLGASRAARYSGLVLRLGPPFADARHRCSEGRQGHEQIMGQPARWISAAGAGGGGVVMMDHPHNPRHPVTWFTRKNLLGAGLLMKEDLVLRQGEHLSLCYGFLVLEEELGVGQIELLYEAFAG